MKLSGSILFSKRSLTAMLGLSQASFVVLLSPSVVAQSETTPYLEEITVTATRRAQSLQDVPISVNTVSGEKLSEAGISKIEDLQAFVPNLTMSETAIGTNIYVRGIGSGINQGFEQSVGTYIDGVFYGRAQLTRAPFLDLERVEVLRGPQNILYGKNSIAGALSLVSAKPTDEFEARFSATIEPEFGDNLFDVMLSGPISDSLSARIAVRDRSADGYVANIDGEDEPSRKETNARATLRWDAGGPLEATLKYEMGRFDVRGRQIEIAVDEPSLNPAFGGATWGQFLLSLNPLANQTGATPTPASVLDNDLNFRRSSNEDFSFNNTRNISLSLNYDYGDYKLTSVSAIVDYDFEERCDCDFTSADIFFADGKENYEQVSQEFRITSPGGGRFDWIGGLYYQSSELDFNEEFVTGPGSSIGNLLDIIFSASELGAVFPERGAQGLVNFRAPRVFEQDSDLLSAFFQGTWNISDRTRVTFGGRYSSEDKEASRTFDFTDVDGNSLPFDTSLVPNTSVGIDYLTGRALQVARHDLDGERSEDTFAPMLGAQFDLSDETMAYITLSRGFKAGGYDARSNTAPTDLTITNPFTSALDFTLAGGSFEYDEEQADTVEVGFKGRFLGGRAELNAAAFFTRYKDLQVSQFDGVLSFNVGNAARAETLGLELDGRVALSNTVTLSGALALLDFEFQDYPNGQCTQLQRIEAASAGQPSPLCDYEGFSNQYVADLSGATSLEYATAISDDLVFTGVLDAIFTTEYNPTQNLDPLLEQDGFVKFNLRLALANNDETWEFALLGKNITDETILTYGNDVPLSANLTQGVGFYGFVEPPRTVAFQGSFRF